MSTETNRLADRALLAFADRMATREVVIGLVTVVVVRTDDSTD